MAEFGSDAVLVVLETTPAGELASSSAGLLGAASTIGTPVALLVADESRHDALAAAAGKLGAVSVLVHHGDEATGLIAPAVDALDAAFEHVRPCCCSALAFGRRA